MNKIEEMIERLCPDGVEYKRISEVYERLKGTPITAAKMREIAAADGGIRIYAGGKTVVSAHEEDIPRANIILTPSVIVQSRGVIDVVYCDVPFTFKNEMWAYTSENLTTVKFLYYILKKDIEVFREIASSTGSFPQISLKVTENYPIPVPPIEIQEEIVRVLDVFAELETELEAELEARKVQYAYYRDRLLNFDNGAGGGSWLNLGELAEIGTGSHDTKDAVTDGKYKFYARGVDVLRLDEYEYDETAIITAGDGVGVGKVMHYVEGRYALHQRAYRIKPNPTLVLPRFFYHYMRATFLDYMEKQAFSSSVKSIRKNMLEKYPIPVPPLEEQERIVAILDKFDALVNDISKGLPAEIEARHKQYEYYRDKLLTFKEKAA